MWLFCRIYRTKPFHIKKSEYTINFLHEFTCILSLKCSEKGHAEVCPVLGGVYIPRKIEYHRYIANINYIS